MRFAHSLRVRRSTPTLTVKESPMPIGDLKTWLQFLNEAPAEIRAYVAAFFWVLVATVLLGMTLRILFSGHFKELYRILGAVVLWAGKGGKVLAKEAARGLELPEPYPRIERFFSILFMLN